MMNFGLGSIGMVLVWLVIVAVAVFAIRGLITLSGRNDEPRQSASEILKRRYAAGEITGEEFQLRRKELDDA